MKSQSIQTDPTFILNGLPIATGICDPEGKIEFVNLNFCNLTGYTSEEVCSTKFLSDIIVDNEKEYSTYWIETLKGIRNGKLSNTAKSITLRKKDNRKIKLQFSVSPLNNKIAFYLQKYQPDIPCTNCESNYKQIVTAADVAIVKFNKNLVITDYSGNSEKIFGFAKEEVIGKNLEETIVPKIESSGRDLDKVLHEVILDTKSYEYNINENLTKSGNRIWMQWYNSEIRDSNNQLTSILSIGIDISDRVKAETALRESQERFKMLSNLTFEGILIHEKGVIVDINLSFERQIGYSRKELIGSNLLDKLIPQKYHKMMIDNIGNDVSEYETEAIHKEGRLIPISIVAKSVEMNNRRVRVVAVRDISALKQTIAELNDYKNHLEELVRKRTDKINHQSKVLEEQNSTLQFERNQLRIIIDNIPDSIYIKDKESRFLNANSRELSLLNETELKDILGKTDFDYYSKKLASKYFADEKKIIKNGIPIIKKEEPSLDEYGNKIYMLTTKVPIKNSEGKVTNIVGIGRDITNRKKAEERLNTQAKNLKERALKIKKLNDELSRSNDKLKIANQILLEQKEEIEATLDQLKQTQNQLVQSEKMASLGILTAGIAHEINNPINFVYAGVNSLIKDFNDIRPVIEAITTLSTQTKNLQQKFQYIETLKEENEYETAINTIPETIEDVKLGAARISEIVSGLSRFSRLESENWRNADLHSELDSALVLLKNKYKNSIKIIKKYDKNIPLVECHPGKLNQVFMNIINNAIDAINDHEGIITITSKKYSEFINISIADTGVGISENDKLRIFDPFYTTKEIGFGVGLGLSISYSILQEHNGEIQVNSILEKGTEFILKIPIFQR